MQGEVASTDTSQRQVMNFVCEGQNKTIADMLGISVKTVELHRAKVISKLKVRIFRISFA